METRAYAERILFGRDLADKLHDPGRLTDAAPGRAITLPDAPARPDGLGFLEAEGKARAAFPKLGALASEAVRGRVLHFFANHEMLALELMALMLLRFPGAPQGFRRGLVQTMRDEQTHLDLYLARMNELGVAFGEVGVNSFFWRCIADVETPAAFAARMSLTFEQANLDFTHHYTQVFRALGDDATSDILDVVLADEVRHVKHGLVWFQRWSPPDVPLWDSYVGHLRFPLTPARAKAFSYQRELRVQAGLPADFIDRLEVFSHSKGKRPTLRWFNPDCEAQIAHGERGRTPNKGVQERIADLETLPMFACGPDDIVLVRRRPRAGFLAELQAAGAALPEFVTDPRALATRTLEDIQPWGWSPDSVALMAPLLARVREERRRQPGDVYSPAIAALFAKTSWTGTLAAVLDEERGAGWLCDPLDVGEVCADADAVLRQRDQLFEAGCSTVVVKAPVGTSGRQALRLLRGVDDDAQHTWIHKRLAQQGALLVAPWRDRVADLSLQLEIAGDGTFKHSGLARFLTDDRGQYLGAVVGRMTAGMPRDVPRFMNADGRDTARVERILLRVAAHVAARCHAAGYRGPAGIDAMIYRLPSGELRLQPLLEVNPRTTMGQIAVALKRFVPQGRCAVWRHFGLREARAAGFEQLGDLLQALRSRVWCLPTNDPETARACLSVLMVAERWAQLPLRPDGLSGSPGSSAR